MAVASFSSLTLALGVAAATTAVGFGFGVCLVCLHAAARCCCGLRTRFGFYFGCWWNNKKCTFMSAVVAAMFGEMESKMAGMARHF
jgi:hypothetical protein